MKKYFGRSSLCIEPMLFLSVMALLILTPSCVTIGNTHIFSSQYDLKNLKYDRTDEGWIAQNEKYRITFKNIPARPVVNQGIEFRLEIFDKTGNKPVAMDETQIECTSLMPDTPGYMRVLALKKQYPGITPEVCSLLPLNFDIPGKWIVIYSISLKSGETFRIDFPVTVNDSTK